MYLLCKAFKQNCYYFLIGELKIGVVMYDIILKEEKRLCEKYGVETIDEVLNAQYDIFKRSCTTKNRLYKTDYSFKY